jgi:hypothetical protein
MDIVMEVERTRVMERVIATKGFLVTRVKFATRHIFVTIMEVVILKTTERVLAPKAGLPLIALIAMSVQAMGTVTTRSSVHATQDGKRKIHHHQTA